MSAFNPVKAQKLINPLVTVIPIKYIDALLVFNNKLKDKNIEWAVSGDIGEILSTVHVEPDCIEIVTSTKGVQQIHQAVQEFNPQEIKRRTEVLPRTARIGGKEYTSRTKSYYFEFEINHIKVRVYGNLQYQISNWGWGDMMEFKPNYISVVGQKIAVIPLEVKYELYLGLGWNDRAKKIRDVLARKRKRIPLRTN